MEHEAQRNDGKDGGRDEEKWVHDSSVDYKGRVALRASTGVWKASLFITTLEFSERLSYWAIAPNLISYLTNVLQQDLKTAATNVNYWAGVSAIMPLAGGFLADAYLGRFTTVLLSSLIYLMGLSLLTMSEFISVMKPCNVGVCHKPRKIHEVLVFVALYLISLGTGGLRPCLQSFGADQFDDDHSEERKKKMSFFNWWNIALCSGILLGVTVIVYVQDKVSWGVADLIITIVMALTILAFHIGKICYRYRLPKGSPPLTPLLQVLVAAMRKRKLPYPSNASQLYEEPKLELSHGRPLCHTSRLRFLDKAAIVEDRENIEKTHNNPWRLATVTKVEEMKLVLSMIPIWLTCLMFGVSIAQASTFFVKQAATMDRRISENFDIPPASVSSLGAIAIMVSVTTYEKILVPLLRKVTGNERGISILQRIGIGMVFSTLSMVAAACVEMKRLKAVENTGPRPGVPLPMTVFWLAPQHIIHGLGDGFVLVGLQEYFYDQAPDSMRSLGIAFYLSVIGVGSLLSSFLITIVDQTTIIHGGKSWIGKDLNTSHLDYFYWMLAALIALNLCAYVFLASRYTYKNVDRGALVTHCPETDGSELKE